MFFSRNESIDASDAAAISLRDKSAGATKSTTDVENTVFSYQAEPIEKALRRHPPADVELFHRSEIVDTYAIR